MGLFKKTPPPPPSDASPELDVEDRRPKRKLGNVGT